MRSLLSLGSEGSAMHVLVCCVISIAFGFFSHHTDELMHLALVKFLILMEN